LATFSFLFATFFFDVFDREIDIDDEDKQEERKKKIKKNKKKKRKKKKKKRKKENKRKEWLVFIQAALIKATSRLHQSDPGSLPHIGYLADLLP
jgi:anaerobic C4-dicarboxylate transporter